MQAGRDLFRSLVAGQAEVSTHTHTHTESCSRGARPDTERLASIVRSVTTLSYRLILALFAGFLGGQICFFPLRVIKARRRHSHGRSVNNRTTGTREHEQPSKKYFHIRYRE